MSDLKKSFLYIVDSLIPSTNANSIQVIRMCAAFAQNGASLRLIAPLPLRKFVKSARSIINMWKFYGEQRRFPVNFLPGPYRWYPVQACWYARLSKPYFVYTRSLEIGACLAAIGVPVAIESHEYDRFLKSGSLQRLLEVAHCNTVLLIVVISQNLKDLYVDFGLPESKILVAHDGVDENLLTQYNVTDCDLKSKLDIGICRPLICYTGKLTADRGIELIIQAAKSLPMAYFLVIGGSQDQVAHWQKVASHIGVKNIKFTGFLDPSKVFYYQRAADVLIAPYTTMIPHIRSISPLKLFEYMAAGKPIVISDLPTIREVVTDGYDAVLVNVDSAKALVEGIRRAFRLASKGLGRNAQQTVTKYTWQARTRLIMERLTDELEHYHVRPQ